jgi:sugar lactone lactonase YvrE
MNVPRLAAALAALALVSACSPALFSARSGRVALTVRWPQRSAAFQILAIPPDTARVVVTIRGEGIPDGKPLEASLVPGQSDQSTEFVDVPVGPKYIEAAALDATGRATASARLAIAVLPNVLVEARLVLQPVSEAAPTPTPAATPSLDVSPAPEASGGIAVPARVIDTAAGDGIAGARDAVDPLAARFRHPRSLAYDARRQALYVADVAHRLIRKVDLTSGAVSTVAGRPETDSGPPSGVPAALAGGESGVPCGLAFGDDGTVYFCDRDNHLVRKITRAGMIETVAGTGHLGLVDGPAAAAQFAYPSDLVVDAEGALYVADSYNNRIRKVAGGRVTTVAGSGTSLAAEARGLKLPPASLRLPLAMAIEPGGAGLVVAEAGAHRVSRVALASGEITPVAGSGMLGLAGEGGDALQADLPLPTALAFDPEGRLVIADGWACETGVETLTGAASRLLRLTADGRLERIAGTVARGAYGFSGDGGDPTRAELNNPGGLAFDAAGRMFVADTFNNRLRVVRPVPLSPVASPPAPVATATPDAGRITPSPSRPNDTP